jgi:hypothetical protein
LNDDLDNTSGFWKCPNPECQYATSRFRCVESECQCSECYQSSSIPSDPADFHEQAGFARWGCPRDSPSNSPRSPIPYDWAERLGFDGSDYPEGFRTEDGDLCADCYAALTDGSDLAEAMQQDPVFSQDPWRQGVSQLQRRRSDGPIAENTFLGAAIWANYRSQADAAQPPSRPQSAPSLARAGGSQAAEPSQYQQWRSARMWSAARQPQRATDNPTTPLRAQSTDVAGQRRQPTTEHRVSDDGELSSSESATHSQQTMQPLPIRPLPGWNAPPATHSALVFAGAVSEVDATQQYLREHSQRVTNQRPQTQEHLNLRWGQPPVQTFSWA